MVILLELFIETIFLCEGEADWVDQVIISSQPKGPVV